MDLIKEIHQFLALEIESINQSILDNLLVEEELVNLVGSHIVNSGGKRIRPILTLLSSKMFDYSHQTVNKLATAVEFIHMATLLHDDVIDGSKMRRFLPSANVIWGSRASILVGDFLFSKSFKLIVDSGSIEAMKILSAASTVIAEGEVAQLAKLQEHNIITEDEYFKIINAKTAELFASACQVGAVISSQPVDYILALRNFGANLGKIFQITDDLLDYFSDSKNTGKNIGDDFAEGKVTLPIIFLSKKISDDQHHKLTSLFASDIRSREDFIWVRDLLLKFDIKQKILKRLEILKKFALDSLSEIKIENKSKEYLKQLVNFAINRNY